MENDENIVIKTYQNPGKNELFSGYDFLRKSCQVEFEYDHIGLAYAKLCLDGLIRFAEYIGAIPLDNPESWGAKTTSPYDAETIIDNLDSFAWKFTLPNPYPNEFGLSTSRGVLSYRVPQALYQAWRIKKLVQGIENPRILEIGAGLGRTAYYANELGIKDYTIIDIPMTATAQGYFLGRTIGENNILFENEKVDENNPKIRIISPQTFIDENNQYDLIVNVDSLTEMDKLVAQEYWEKIKTSTNTFLSINHESNSFTVRDLLLKDLTLLNISREQYWMRRGYVEELIKINT
nr:putative sugar O-methyltransferase [Paraglaciecola arctica]